MKWKVLEDLFSNKTLSGWLPGLGNHILIKLLLHFERNGIQFISTRQKKTGSQVGRVVKKFR